MSLFEPHTYIIRKGGRRVQHGHKVNLGSGPSGLLPDAVVEAGNPPDSARCLPMIERHTGIYGAPPEQVACDGGYASKANLEEAKELGVRDVVFHQKRGIAVADMASSPKVHGRLRNIRAGMEAVVSYLKRFGLRRCNRRGLEHFRSYVWSPVVTHNLWVIARHKLRSRPATTPPGPAPSTVRPDRLAPVSPKSGEKPPPVGLFGGNPPSGRPSMPQDRLFSRTLIEYPALGPPNPSSPAGENGRELAS